MVDMNVNKYIYKSSVCLLLNALFCCACQSIIQVPPPEKPKPRPQVIIERTDSGKFKVRISKSGGQLSEAEIREIVARYVGDPRGAVPHYSGDYVRPQATAASPSYLSTGFSTPQLKRDQTSSRKLHQSYALELNLHSSSCEPISGFTGDPDFEEDVNTFYCSATQSKGWFMGGAFELFATPWLAFHLGVLYRSSDLNGEIPVSSFTLNESSYALDYDLLIKPRYTLRSNSFVQMGIEGLIFELGAGVTVRNIFSKLTSTDDGSGEASITTPALKLTAGVKLLLKSRWYAGLTYAKVNEGKDYEVCVSSEDFEECVDQDESGLPNLPGRTSLGINLGYIF